MRKIWCDNEKARIQKTKQTAKDARNAYARAWRAANPDKVRLYNERYWTKQAEKITSQTE